MGSYISWTLDIIWNSEGIDRKGEVVKKGKEGEGGFEFIGKGG